jgi:small multidrug resistance pump
MAWAYLACAVILEVLGTLTLRRAALGRAGLYAVVVACYAIAFVLLSLALSAGLGIGVAYGIWAASGVALIAVASRLLFNEPLSPLMVAGVGLIIAGILLVEVGRGH